MVTQTKTDDGQITYTDGSKSVTIYGGDLACAAFTARDWHGGQWSSLYRLACGADDYETVCDAATELASAIDAYSPARDEPYDADGMIEAQSALETLERVANAGLETE